MKFQLRRGEVSAQKEPAQSCGPVGIRTQSVSTPDLASRYLSQRLKP